MGRCAALALEQHVAPAAVRSTRGLGHGVEGNRGEQSTQKNPFHSFVLFLVVDTKGQGYLACLSAELPGAGRLFTQPRSNGV
ncbi:hypothetical protein D3C78_1646330 [compost metagenome]